MSTTIDDIQQASDSQSSKTKVESEKVTRFLKIRYKSRKTREKVSSGLDSLAAKLDPRANQEDYLRRRQRLQELIDTTRENPALAVNGDLVKALNAGKKTIEDTDAAVKSAQDKGQRPDYGGQRDLLKIASDKVESAIAKANKRNGKVDKANPELADDLSAIGELLDDPGILAPDTELAKWRKQHTQATASFYSDNPNPRLAMGVGLLRGNIEHVIGENAKKLAAVKQRSAELLQAMTSSDLPIDQLSPIDALIKRAGREASVLDFDTANATLTEAENLLPVGPRQKPPTMDAVEQARKDLKQKAMAALIKYAPPKQPPRGVVLVASEPGRKRVVDLLHRLDELAPLCQQTENEVAVEAMRRITTCEQEFDKICQADPGTKNFENEKKSLQDYISEQIAGLTDALDKESKTGAVVKLQVRLTDLSNRFAAQWPKLMTQDDVDNSGLMLETTNLVEAFDEWKESKNTQPQQPQGWQQEFAAAADRLRQVTEDAKKKNIGLLQTYGLAGPMPALVIKGTALITGAEPAKFEKDVRAMTRQLLDTVNLVTVQLENADPGDLESMLEEGERLAKAFGVRIDTQVLALQNLQPGKKTQKAKNFAKFFKESAFGDDDERALRIIYGASLKETLDGLTSLLRCKDPTAVKGALDEIKAFEWKVKDFEAMGASGGKPREKDGSQPPTFAELQSRIKAIKKKIDENTKDSDLGTRVDTLKGWSEEASALSDEIGESDPRELETRIGALEREIISKTNADKIEIGKANAQLVQVTNLLIKVMDARKKGSPLRKDFGPLLAKLQREGEAMKKALEQWKITDAGFDAFKKDVDALLNESRSDEETNALSTKSGEAAKADQDVEAARKELLKLRDADLKLWKEKFELVENKERKKMLLKLVDDLTKEAERGLDSLAENRDADGARSLVKAALRELSEAGSGQGDEVTARGDLEQLNTGWRNAVAAVGDALNKLDQAVNKQVAEGNPNDDVKNAAAALRQKLVQPVLGIFSSDVFSASIKAMSSKDPNVRATNREAALSEVRRLRRVMESDSRVRLLAMDNPFGVTVPFPEISSRLFDIEVNVTRARGA
jgi:hypothetical protein